MTREELNTLAPKELIEAVQAAKLPTKYEDGQKQYDPALHEVKKRPQKPTLSPIKGQFEDDGITPKVETKFVDVSKIAVPLQKYIIQQRASFAVGNKITFKPDIPDSPVFEAAMQAWRGAKMQYLLKEVAVKLMSETEVALLWYSVVDTSPKSALMGGVKMRNRVISPSTGDSLYPVFDRYNDMIAFGRGYKVDEVEYFDLYTAETLRRFKQDQGDYVEYFTKAGQDEEGNPIPMIEALPYGKIPVVYWRQEKPECHDTQDLFDARELSFSDFVDNNKYFGQPPLFFKGAAVNMPAKGTPGMTFSGSPDADAKFLTGGNTAGSRELEFEKIDTDIFTMNRAARLDAESMKGLGDLSAAAMDRMLISPHMAARDMQDGEFGRGIQRCINFLLAVYSDVLGVQDGVEAEPQFSLFRIDDAAERIELAMKANGNKPVLDQEESIRMAGVSDYPEEAFKKLQEEARANIQNAAQGMQNRQGRQRQEEGEPNGISYEFLVGKQKQ